MLGQVEEKGLLPDIDVYVDSPLSLNATNIMRLHTECFNDEIKEYMKTDKDPFGLKRLRIMFVRLKSLKLLTQS